jgi:hypothetical protein
MIQAFADRGRGPPRAFDEDHVHGCRHDPFGSFRLPVVASNDRTCRT